MKPTARTRRKRRGKLSEALSLTPSEAEIQTGLGRRKLIQLMDEGVLEFAAVAGESL